VTDGATTGIATGLIGTVLSGRYRLESKLGSGGMSTVYLARDETLERSIAVKVMHGEISDQPDQIERFRREARSVAQVSHPNVVAVIDAGEDAGHPYIVFEHIEGETLKQRIDRLGRLPVDEAAAYGIEIGRGLAAAHARMLVHRDVKPQNVLIDTEGRAKVTDFGIARSLESDGLTKTGRVLGTTDYVSPEQAMGQGVDARSDIYSLGILLYEMLTGNVPFEAETLIGVAMKHVNEPMPNVQERRPEVSSALAAVIEKATEKEPKRRYADMAEMLDDLETALEVEVARAGGAHGEATTVIDSVPRRRRKLNSRNVSVAGVVIVLLATVAALLIAALTGGDEKSSGGGGGSSAPPSGAAIKLVSANDYDPEGDPPGEEHGTEVKNAIDGNPDTAWTTEDYTTPEFAKSGVGIYVDTGEAVDARAMKISTAESGWVGAVYATADSPPTDIQGWGAPIARIPDGGTEETVQLNTVDGPYRYYLLWFTSPADLPDGGYGVEVNEIELTS
jgi:eukaryotic-like serine/threonine-protein kinase